jgi:hypothetical protein
MKHKHAEVIRAFIDGKECECWSKSINDWHPHPISSLAAFDFCETVRIKPNPKPKEYYDENTFDIQYLHVYNHITQGKTCMSSTLMKETYGKWIYMGKVRLEK